MNDRGFTLPEMLIVLAVVSIMAAIGVAAVQPALEWTQKRMFISQLESDLYHVQSQAINRKETIVFQFSKEQNQYAAMAGSKTILTRELPAPIRMTGGNLSRFHITPDGTISHFGTVQFQLNGHEMELTIFLGRGRFIVKE
jgi:competence protein ComGD